VSLDANFIRSWLVPILSLMQLFYSCCDSYILPMDESSYHCIRSCLDPIYNLMWGGVVPICGDLGGDILGENERQRKTLPDKLAGPSKCLLGQRIRVAKSNVALRLVSLQPGDYWR
jgi:hypothetical protein